MRTWQNPDRTYHRMFLMLAPDCDPDPYPGVVIVSDANHNRAFVAEVQNLQKELPQLLKRIEGEAVAYWDLEMDVQERKEILRGLTSHPIFVG